MGDVNQELKVLLLCIKVLYNIKTNKQIQERGEGQYLNPKHIQVI